MLFLINTWLQHDYTSLRGEKKTSYYYSSDKPLPVSAHLNPQGYKTAASTSAFPALAHSSLTFLSPLSSCRRVSQLHCLRWGLTRAYCIINSSVRAKAGNQTTVLPLLLALPLGPISRVHLICLIPADLGNRRRLGTAGLSGTFSILDS